jgi:protein TonB
VAHLAALVLVHWMIGGTWLRVMPPPRGTVSIDLQAAWASAGSGMDGDRRQPPPLTITAEIPEPPVELVARRLPESRVGQLPPVRSDQLQGDGPDAPRLLTADPPPNSSEPNQEMPDPALNGLPALPRSRRAIRAGIDVADRLNTEAWLPPSVSMRRSEGAQTDAQPLKVFSPQPDYPPDLLAARITGSVKLLVHVQSDGRVARASIHRTSGHPALDRAALEAVRRWRFEPARRAGVPIALDILVPVRFTIR